MKKLVMTVAVLACASSVFSADTVTSANVVGYAKVATPVAGAVDIISVTQFPGTNATVSIQDVIGNLEDLNSSAVKANADKIYVWLGNGYSSYGLYYKASTTESFWMATGSIGWTLASQANPSTDALARGTSVWYETGTGGIAATAITSGDVPDDGTFDVALAGAVDLVSFPYSADINLTELVVANATSSSIKANADKIYVWLGNGYASYGLYYKASTTESFWMATGSIGWTLASQANPTSAVISLGQGFWYESISGPKTISFATNYTLD